MQVSINGRNFIKCQEQCKLKSYKDTGGVLTIGWGHTEGVYEGQIITIQQAEQFLSDDLKEVENDVNNFSQTLKQHEFDMMVDAVFNLGTSFLEWWNNPDPARRGIGTFTRCVSDNGVIYSGLLKRRAMESYIFQCSYTQKALDWIASNIK
jgi:lysozyme